MIKTTYRDEEIRYSEDDNLWFWQGSSRGLVSLKAARQSIDRALDGEAGQPKFKRCSAILNRFSEFEIIEVTSRKSDREFWIKGKGGRRAEMSSFLKADTPENRAKIEECKQLDKEIEALNAKRTELEATFQPLSAWLKENDAKAVAQ